ncbi:MAG: type II toxin-antitoxin system HicA family toxin [Methanosarcinaceae archaeon]|nr:type II toxin-antitoxin system HicA family toxin [Methanosarcinaceae archaeon]
MVPLHGNEEIGIGLLKEILAQAMISRETYEKMRRKI